jgi:hypothetical protein
VELITIDPRNPDELKRSIARFAREPNSGLIVTASPSAVTNRHLITSLALQYRLPNIYPFRCYPASGGLASYGPDPIDAHKSAAGYVDRILKGKKPADLPVQAPTKYMLVAQPQDCEDARSRLAVNPSRARRRGDRIDSLTSVIGPGCVKTLRGITAPGILGSTVTRREKTAKICLPLGVTTKSDFVFTRPRPLTDVSIALAKVCFEGRSGSGADLPPRRSLTLAV